MLIRLHLFLLSFISLILVASQANAQTVALVLSGGGAKGMAHVGVIKALEENHIPIDYVVGTSMGGVVGGFYAAAYSPTQMEEILLSEDFKRWMNGSLPPDFNYYFFQEDPNPAWLSLDLAIDSTLHTALKSNLASDLGLNFALAEMLGQASYHAGNDFDSLFVPFRAVCSDIYTQNQVILKDGSLNKAVRNTMTIPLFYRPIKNKNMYLFDGGLYNNFAVDVARKEFNPDVIIGVNVSDKNYDTYPFDNDESLVAESIQSIVLSFLDKSDSTQIDSSGVYLEPRLGDITAFDFGLSQKIINHGYEEANRHMEEIKAKVSRRNYVDEVTRKRSEYLASFPPLNFNGITLHGFNQTQAAYVRRFFNMDKKNLSVEDIQRKYYRLVSEGYFKTVYPDMVFNPDHNSFDLQINAEPKNVFKIDFGGTVATRHISMAYLGLEFTQLQTLLLNTRMSLANGSFYKAFELRSRINLPTQKQLYFEPIFSYNSFDFINGDDILVPEKIPTLLNQIDRRAGIMAGMPVKTKGKLVLHGFYLNNTDFFSSAPFLQPSNRMDKIGFSGLRAGIEYTNNSLNRKQYPSKGNAVIFSMDYFNGTEKFRQGSTGLIQEPTFTDHSWFRAKFSVEQYTRLTNWLSAGYLVEGVFSNQKSFSNYMGTLVYAPAFNPMNDSKTLFLQQFRSPNYAAAGLRTIASLGKKIDFRAEGYSFKPFTEIIPSSQDEAIRTFDPQQFYVAGSAGFVYHGPLGPVAFTVNYYDDRENRLGFLIHLGYLIYNRRSLE